MTIPRQGVHTASELRRSTCHLDRCLAGVDQTLGAMRMGVDCENFSDADPIAFDAAQAAEGIQPPNTVMFRLSVTQREWLEDLVAPAGP